MMYEATFYNYSQTRDICQALFELQESGDSSCDVRLVIDHGKEIRVHGFIFAASSKVLQDLLTKCCKSEFTNTLNITNIGGDALQILIKYLYTGELCLTVDSVAEILKKSTDWRLSFVEEKCNCFVKNHDTCSFADLDLGFQSSDCSVESVGNGRKCQLQLRNNDTSLPNSDCSEIALLHDKSCKDQTLPKVELCSQERCLRKKIYQSSSVAAECSRNSRNTATTCVVKDEPATCLNTPLLQSDVNKMSKQRNLCQYQYTLNNLTEDKLPSCNTYDKPKDKAVEETALFVASPLAESSGVIGDNYLSLLQKSSDMIASQKNLESSAEISIERGTFLTDINLSPVRTVINTELGNRVLRGTRAVLQDSFFCESDRRTDVKNKTKNKPEHQKKFNVSNDSQIKPEKKLEASSNAPKHLLDHFEQQSYYTEDNVESQQTGAKTQAGANTNNNDRDFSITSFDMSDDGMKTVRVHNFTCSKCHGNLGTAASLVQHLCLCGKSKQTKRTLMHRRIYKCPECNFCSSRSQSYLDEHMFKKHNKQVESNLKFLICRVSSCDYQTLQPKLLSLHMNRHRKEKPFMCEECGARLKSEGILVRHMKRHKNPNKKPFRCSECGNSLGSKMSLQLHVRRLHQRQLNFLCANCPYRAFSKDALESHQFSVHGICPPSREIHRCQHCDWKTLVKSHLQRHLQRHFGEKLHECSICRSRFVDFTELSSHKKRHSKDSRQVQCTFAGCSYTEYTKHKLNEHIRMTHTHKGEKPWKGEMCDHRTALKGNLTKHLRTVHKVEVTTKQKRLARVDSHEISHDWDQSPAKNGVNTGRTLNSMTTGTPGSDPTGVSTSNNSETRTMHTRRSSANLIRPSCASRTLTCGKSNDSLDSVVVNLSQPPTTYGISRVTPGSVQFGFGTGHRSSSDIYNPGLRTEQDQLAAIPLLSPHP